ncbi:hypothetical protein K438DRAFT_1964577 [Mycena galopus ATCC 62051]|nr:hypothetical protein K438DRAFT_1964577 [Mycena galopus ATCC 62051]
MPFSRSTRIRSDAYAAMKVTLNAIQACTDAYPPLKSCISTAIVVVEMCEVIVSTVQRVKSNKKGCEHIAKRSARIVQDIWRQREMFGHELPVEVEESVAEIEKLFKEIQSLFAELKKENRLQRLARQDRNKVQIEEYGRLLDEAMVHFSFNLNLSMHRLQLESVVAHEKRHADVLDLSRMSEAERLQFLAQIRGKVLCIQVESLSD